MMVKKGIYMNTFSEFITSQRSSLRYNAALDHKIKVELHRGK